MSTAENLKYSIVIAPPQAGIDYVAQLKDELDAKIGWYNSKNSKAHVTIIEFTADEDELVKIIAHLKELASYEQPIHLSFDGVSSYPNGAIFLKPDEATKLPLTDLMINIQKKLKIKNSYKSKDPHISIGRKLSDENVEIALQLLANAKLDFYCTHLILRKFNPDRKQYDYFSEDFMFLGKPADNLQHSLW